MRKLNKESGRDARATVWSGTLQLLLRQKEKGFVVRLAADNPVTRLPLLINSHFASPLNHLTGSLDWKSPRLVRTPF